jgi:hypothetical protein
MPTPPAGLPLAAVHGELALARHLREVRLAVETGRQLRRGVKRDAVHVGAVDLEQLGDVGVAAGPRGNRCGHRCLRRRSAVAGAVGIERRGAPWSRDGDRETLGVMTTGRYVAVVRVLAVAAVVALLDACERTPAGCQCSFPIDASRDPSPDLNGQRWWTRIPTGCTEAEFAVVDGGSCHNLYQPSGPLEPPDLLA